MTDSVKFNTLGIITHVLYLYKQIYASTLSSDEGRNFYSIQKINVIQKLCRSHHTFPLHCDHSYWH